MEGFQTVPTFLFDSMTLLLTDTSNFAPFENGSFQVRLEWCNETKPNYRRHRYCSTELGTWQLISWHQHGASSKSPLCATNVRSTKYSYGNQIEEDVMGGACSTRGRDEKFKHFGRKNW